MDQTRVSVLIVQSESYCRHLVVHKRDGPLHAVSEMLYWRFA